MNQKKIVILGDCWAESMWRCAGTTTLVNGHLTGLLEKKGCAVYNFGTIGMSNYHSWNLYKNFILKLEKPDLIVWFHTTPIRDLNSFLINPSQEKNGWPIDNWEWKLHDLVHITAKKVYREISDIISEFKIDNIFLVEGQASVVEPEFSKYIPEPVYTVKSWRNKILDMPNLPDSKFLGLPSDMFEMGLNLDSNETKVKELENQIQILKAMNDSPMFPDNAHPGPRPYKQLADRIINFLNRMTHNEYT